MSKPICPDADEYTCENCEGHNRCESEMVAGFGLYEAEEDKCFPILARERKEEDGG
jgi:hypothetical protein